jgi:hypothetical protein
VTSSEESRSRVLELVENAYSEKTEREEREKQDTAENYVRNILTCIIRVIKSRITR